ncbi:hypothetical protein QM012_005414 [Aureobasidium pullulans]|uniref:COMPASS complex Set1 subunit N-SET domain-containing protein n=1 Tax=Aureobasidium pullulans TaxID=5580 RepID=A0ABR0T6E3_AURPU
MAPNTPSDTRKSAAANEPEWVKSTTLPLKTVEDDPNLVMDLDGWKAVIKDDEDMSYLKQALKDVPAANLGDANAWVKQQEQEKFDNELKAHVAAVAAAPEELKKSLLTRSKSTLYDSIRTKKDSDTSADEVDKTENAHVVVNKTAPSN